MLLTRGFFFYSIVFFFKQKTAYEMRISDWSSDVCSSDLFALGFVLLFRKLGLGATLGFLVAGAVVGPQVLGLVGGAESKMGIAELGITLLLFIVGLELKIGRAHV